MDPTTGQVTRMWNDYLGSTGKPLGLRGSAQNLSQYCGFDNANGPSGPRAGNWGPVAAYDPDWKGMDRNLVDDPRFKRFVPALHEMVIEYVRLI
jgi:hypothetical protein